MRRVSALLFLGLFSVLIAQPLAEREVISVTGQGEVEVEPDLAVVEVGVTTIDLKAEKAYDQNARAIKGVIEALRKMGVAEEDLKTVHFSLTPQYDHSGKRPRLLGYEARHGLQVRVRRLDQVGLVLDRAVEAGATDIWGINFILDDPTRAEEEARRRAVEDAKDRAAELARLAGVEIGLPVYIAEEKHLPAPPVPRMMYLEAQATPIEPGPLTVRVVVTVSYEIEGEG